MTEKRKKNPFRCEKQKRNIGLNLCKRKGMTHFLSMDVDEFYDPMQLKNAKIFIEKNKIEASAVTIYEYLKQPEYRIVEGYTYEPQTPYNFYVPFITKIKKFTIQKHGKGQFCCFTDLSRTLNAKNKFYLFPVQDIIMHHMSTVRKDLQSKYRNSNLNLVDEDQKIYIKELQQDILNWSFEENQIANTEYSLFRNKIIQKVTNKFNIYL